MSELLAVHFGQSQDGDPISRNEELRRKCVAYHVRNPDVRVQFDKWVRQLIDAGRSRYGADAIMERIRWETALGNPKALRPFKIANEHASFYAHDWAWRYPGERRFFSLKNQKTHWEAPLAGRFSHAGGAFALGSRLRVERNARAHP